VNFYLLPFKERLKKRATKQEWYELQQPQYRFSEHFDSPKIIFPDIAKSPRFALDELGYYDSNTTYFIPRYDERDIAEYKSALSLSEDIAIRTLASGMMQGIDEDDIRDKIKIFLTPERTKTHGRPIYKDEAANCNLHIEVTDVKSKLWELVYELYIRTSNYVSSSVAKCIESKYHSFAVGFQDQ
jgi:hypothetical protein